MKSLIGPIVKLSIFALITVVVSYLLIATVQNTNYGKTTSYQAQFSDVTGLVKGDDVRISGVRVGQVGSIEVADDGNGNAIAQVGLTVDRATPLPTSVQATIKYRNLVGQRYIALTEGSGQAGAQGTGTLKAGAVIPLAQTTPALDLTQLFNGFQPLFQALDPTQLNRLSFEVIQVFQGEGGTVESLLSHVASLTNSLADKDQVIGSVIENLSAVLGTVAQRDQELSDLVVNLQQFVSALAQDKDAIFDSIASIDDLATSTTDLLAQARAPLADDITQLGALSTNLADNQDDLTQFLQNEPDKLRTITLTAANGSWFNFYLCGFSGQLTIPGGTTLPVSGAETCSSGG